MTDAQMREHDEQPYVVLRFASAEEWLAELVADGGAPPDFPLDDLYFYDVSVD